MPMQVEIKLKCHKLIPHAFLNKNLPYFSWFINFLVSSSQSSGVGIAIWPPLRAGFPKIKI